MSGFGALDALARRPDATVLVVHARHDTPETNLAEHLDAAREKFPEMAVVSMRGPSGDPKIMAGRDVVFWPWLATADSVRLLRGFAAVVARSATRVRMIAPKDSTLWKGPAAVEGDAVAWARAVLEPVEAAPDLNREWFDDDDELQMRESAAAERADLSGVPRGADEAAAGQESQRTHQVAGNGAARAPRETNGLDRPAYVQDYVPSMIEEDFPEPTNFFESAPLPKLSKLMLPQSLADYIFDQSEIIGSDPCILAMSVLVACAAVTSDSLKLQPKEHEPGWKEAARLWGAFVGDPSVKKTPPLARAMAHVRSIDAAFAKAGKESLRKFAIAKRVYEAQEKRFIDQSSKNQPVSALSEAPERPQIRRIVVQDATVEAVSDVMSDNPQGVLVLMDELSGFFGSMDAYRAQGSKDRSFWLEAYNGGPRRIDRISREARHVDNCSACILGGIQPGLIREKARTLTDDGLLQRFMVVIAEAGDSLGVDRRANSAAAQAYRSILDWLVTCEGEPDRPIQFDDSARIVLRRVEMKLNAFTREDRLPLRMRYQLGKWSGLYCRLCLTFWAIECANLAVPVDGRIAGDVCERVENLLFEYLFWHLKYFYESVIGDSTDAADMARKVGLWLLAKQPPRITSSLLSHGVRGWRSLNWRARRDVIDTLELCGWVVAEPKRPGGGAAAWIVNARVFELFSEIATKEQARRDGLRDAILGSVAEKQQRDDFS